MARKFRELEAGMPAEAIAASDTIRARLKETALESPAYGYCGITIELQLRGSRSITNGCCR